MNTTTTAQATETLRSTMERAFDLVDPAMRATALLGHSNHGKTWKDPICSLLPQSELDSAGVTIEQVAEAIAFYTATEAGISAEKIGRVGAVDHHGAPGYLVMADGYRRGPAGDH